ncbi:MAG: hypothetical protein AAF806_25770 [Bacteroidota bacterium]
MRIGLVVAILLFLSTGLVKGQEGTFTYNGDRKARIIPPGTGKEYSENFIFFTDLHFVQFGVYSSDYNRYEIKAPKEAGQVWLIYHRDTQIQKANNFLGAYYIVKAFGSAAEARAAVDAFKARKIDCWYNPDLTNIEFVLIGITGGV